MGFFGEFLSSAKTVAGREYEKNVNKYNMYSDRASGMSNSELKSAYYGTNDSIEKYAYEKEAQRRKNS